MSKYTLTYYCQNCWCSTYSKYCCLCVSVANDKIIIPNVGANVFVSFTLISKAIAAAIDTNNDNITLWIDTSLINTNHNEK